MATLKAMIRATKGKKTAFVRFRVSDGRNKQYFYKSGISVMVSLWDSKKECINTRKVCNTEYRNATNERIFETRQNVLEVYERYADQITNSNDLVLFIEGKQIQEHFAVSDICECITAYVEELQSKSASTKYHYYALRTCLKRYILVCGELHRRTNFVCLKAITETDIRKFSEFLKDEHKRVKQFPTIYKMKLFDDISRKGNRPIEERGNNTIYKYLKDLKCVLRWATRKGYVLRNVMDGYNIGKEIYGTPYYLTIEERDQILNFDLSSNKLLEVARDAFIFQCFVGCRIGDLSRLTWENINNGYLEYVPQKTKHKRATCLRVPLHKSALQILERYKGQTDKDGKIFPLAKWITDKNDRIKKVFTLVGITRKVLVMDSITQTEHLKPLNEIASTHLARRTFIGNLYKQVKDPCIISSMSGHAPNSTAFARYRTIDDQIKEETISLL